jgi:phytoene/squalene synthetase
MSSSFSWPVKLVTGDRGRALRAIQIYCRTLDDIADDMSDDRGAEGRRAALAEWQAHLQTGPAALPPDLRWAVERYSLPISELQRILDGVLQDVAPTDTPFTRNSLKQYCRCVAGAVGVLIVRILTPARPQHDAFAILAGEALQLTNIIRDVAEDAAMGRCYLPHEYRPQQNITSAINRLVADTDALYAQTWHEFVRCDRRALWPAAAMVAIYGQLLSQLKHRADLQVRPKISSLSALTWCARARLGLLP